MTRAVGTPILDSASGSKTYGIATLSSGAATITTTSVKTASVIVVTPMAGGTLLNLGLPIVQQADITNGTSFIIRSVTLGTPALNVLDNNKVSWMILEPTDNP